MKVVFSIYVPLLKDQSMSLKTVIKDDIVAAMKSKNKFVVNALRMLNSEIGYKEKEKGTLDEDQLLTTIASYHKKLQKNVKTFPEGSQKKVLLKEIEIVGKYLPPKASIEEHHRVAHEIYNNEQSKGGKLNGDKLAGLVIRKLGVYADPLRAKAMIAHQIVSEGNGEVPKDVVEFDSLTEGVIH